MVAEPVTIFGDSVDYVFDKEVLFRKGLLAKGRMTR